jgi:acetamidase/formamidase
VEGTWPIAVVIARTGTTVEVELLDHDPREKSGQEILLRGAGSVWTVERLGLWISD